MKAIAIVDQQNNLSTAKHPVIANIPEDKQFFQSQTTRNIVVMGRKTAETFKSTGYCLPSRWNIIMTKDNDFMNTVLKHEKATSPVSFVTGVQGLFRQLYKLYDHGIIKTPSMENVFVIGGGSVYRQLLPYCNDVYLTRVLDYQISEDDWFVNNCFPDLSQTFSCVNTYPLRPISANESAHHNSYICNIEQYIRNDFTVKLNVNSDTPGELEFKIDENLTKSLSLM